MVTEQQASVAVVLCTYNGEQHLSEQLQSLVAQTWPIAVFVFDDGSTDGTIDCVNRFQSKLQLVVHVNQENLGYVANFERGMQSVLDSGYDYIALCDQDDIWEPTRIAQGMEAIIEKEHELGEQSLLLAHSDLTLIDENKQLLHSSFFRYRRYNIGESKSLPLVLGQNGVMGNTILMNRAMAQFSLPFPKQLHVHDYWLAILAELYGHRILLKDALVSYRIHKGNASNSSESIPLGVPKSRTHKPLGQRFNRNYELPFKEDSRLEVLRFIANNSQRFPQPDASGQKTLSVFKDYLEFKGSRVKILVSMFKQGFFRTGLRHRYRVIYRALLTKRYTK